MKKLLLLAFIAVISAIVLVEDTRGKEMQFRNLTPEEERVIVNKGTERPFSGDLLNNKEPGTYHCKRCNAALYKSQDKFKSGCGWPSFDDEISGSVKRLPDADGSRVEIVCSACNAHLGHVFTGEGFTPKNTRHCVNSISMVFVPEKPSPSKKLSRGIFAGGCFWGVEHFLKQQKGVESTSVGYIGGKTENPTYQQVCHEGTDHAEAVLVEYDPAIVEYEELAKLFFEIHDFTQIMRQGPDIGNQYRTEVFYTDNNQKEILEKIVKQLTEMGYKVATKITPASHFWPAEDYHQDYYSKTGKSPYCHSRKKIFNQ